MNGMRRGDGAFARRKSAERATYLKGLVENGSRMDGCCTSNNYVDPLG